MIRMEGIPIIAARLHASVQSDQRMPLGSRIERVRALLASLRRRRPADPICSIFKELPMEVAGYAEFTHGRAGLLPGHSDPQL